MIALALCPSNGRSDSVTETAAKRFGKWLREARKAVGISQTDFADLMGVSRGTMSNLENGVLPSENGDPNEPRHITPYLIRSLVRVLRERGSSVTEAEASEAVGILPTGRPSAVTIGEYRNPRSVVVRDEAYEPYAHAGQVVLVCQSDDLTEDQREDTPAVVTIDGERRVVMYRGRGRDPEGRPAYQLEDDTGIFFARRNRVVLEEFIVLVAQWAKQGGE